MEVVAGVSDVAMGLPGGPGGGVAWVVYRTLPPYFARWLPTFVYWSDCGEFELRFSAGHKYIAELEHPVPETR